MVIVLSIFVTFTLLVLWVESLHRHKIKNALVWIINKPISFLINLLLLWHIFSILMCLLNSTNISLALTSLLILMFAVGNKNKIHYRGDPVFPSDLALKKECFHMGSYFKNKETLMDIFLMFIFSIAIFLVLANTQWLNISRIINLSLSLFFIVLLLARDIHLLKPLFKKLKIDEFSHQQDKFYDKHGFIFAFVLNIKNIFHPRIENYSSEKIHSILDSNLFNNKTSNNNLAENKPNIIIIMNESFWNPSVIETIRFHEVLTPTINSLKKDFPFGSLISPEFGGGTSNIEFEFLTGHNTHFLPTGSMAFQNYLNKPIESLPFHMKRKGYKTIGLHSYKRWFWKRETAYKFMGFDDFISCENFNNPEIKGLYISDMEFSKKVIEIYENTSEPLFLYGITMQNHGPYRNSRYDNFDITVDTTLDNDALSQLKTFSQGVYDGDKALKVLIDYFDKISEPAIVVFFGDHLPMLGKDFSTFINTDYIKGNRPVNWSIEEKLKMASTPLIMWSNYKNNDIELDNISPSFLGAKVLDYAGIEKPPYFDFLSNLSQISPILSSRVPNIFNNSIEKDTFEQLVSQYKLLQYDQLFGENYMYTPNSRFQTTKK